ncbi:putative rhodopsin-like orphan GPCR [Schistosoma mansoni]|uniref:putative rhodopsin-like orphan GPCR n=1 Tax=Schistosoma mansoni TaxID=6183 RepID=UPI0001A62D0A|nr:putative rhodopsin-like orphan GPCR [Schistosoma mansoni]|eukprot:XP_018655587.1 putative rhodopsin-like orphan GPCR [Schistosoma mansoni]
MNTTTTDILLNNSLHQCNNLHETDHISFIQSIISVILLSLICILGIIGNSLVIIVYCIKPKSNTNRFIINHTIMNNNTKQNVTGNKLDTLTIKNPGSNPSTFNKDHFNLTRKSNKLLLRRNTLSQQNLILLLAFIDLLTCVFILPWDIYRVANYAYDETIPIPIPIPIPIHEMYGNISIQNHTGMNDVKGFYTHYKLNAILTLLRNIIFACEGSVLAAIAFERYMILVQRGICKSICCLPLNTIENNKNMNGKTMNSVKVSSLFQKGTSARLNESTYDTTIHSTNVLADSSSVRTSPKLMNPRNSNGLKYKSNEVCKPNTCITSMLITVIIGTCLFECILIVLDLSKWDCQLTERLRELVNQVYILLTFLSFIIITYLYARIFRTVRENDLRKQRWLTVKNVNYSSMKILNKSNSFLQSSVYDSEVVDPGVMKLTGESESTSSIPLNHQKPHEHNCHTLQSRRSGLSYRLIKQLSCDQVITNQYDTQCIQWNTLKKRANLKTPSISTLFEHPHDKQETMIKHNNNNNQSIHKQMINIATTTTTTTTTTIQSPISLSVNRLVTKRVTRSHRTGLMIFISTVIFYATLFPVLWVHFKFCFDLLPTLRHLFKLLEFFSVLVYLTSYHQLLLLTHYVKLCDRLSLLPLNYKLP